MIKTVIGAVIGFFWGVWCTQSAYEQSERRKKNAELSAEMRKNRT